MEWQDDVDFIFGYLDQCKKMNKQPEKIIEILLFLLKKLKNEQK